MSDRSPEWTNNAVAMLAAAAFAFMLPHEPAVADVFGCDDADRFCIDGIYSSRCAERGTTQTTCEALALEAEAIWSGNPTTGAGELLGLVYYRLAELAEAESIELDYRQRSHEVMRAVAAADPLAIGARQMLAVHEWDQLERRIEWLRQVLAIDAGRISIGFLTGALLESGTREGIVDALSIYQEQYDAAPAGSDKWYWAQAIHNLMEMAEPRFNITIDPVAIAGLDSRVRRDSNWDRTLEVLAAPADHLDDVSTALETACSLTALFGQDTCFDGIERAVLAARLPSARNARALADAAARGIQLAPRGGIVANEELQTRRRTHARWLLEFADYDLDSIVVLDAIGSISEASDFWIEARLEIVNRIPEDGEARFQLGKVYFDRRYWAEAVPQFERARELLPAEEWYQIDGYLRQARYEVGAGR